MSDIDSLIRIATYGARPRNRSDEYVAVNRVPLCLPSIEAIKAFIERNYGARSNLVVFCWESGEDVDDA